MKRGGPLPRYTDIRRGGRLTRKSRMKPRSDKMRAVYEVRVELVVALLASQPWCQIRWDDGCEQRAIDVHEPGMRSRSQVDITDENECVTACRYCHDQVHAHPKEAVRRGWLKPSGPVEKPWEAA